MDFTQDLSRKPTKRTGRPPFEVTGAKKAKVAELAKLGLPVNQIARSLRISAKTLRKHFRDELDDSAIEANRQVLAKIFELAINGHAGAATFWARTRCNFRNGGSPLDDETSPSAPTSPGSPTNLHFRNNDGDPLEEW
jgi:hypothetical protein